MVSGCDLLADSEACCENAEQVKAAKRIAIEKKREANRGNRSDAVGLTALEIREQVLPFWHVIEGFTLARKNYSSKMNRDFALDVRFCSAYRRDLDVDDLITIARTPKIATRYRLHFGAVGPQLIASAR